jgi:hypothetical protein
MLDDFFSAIIDKFRLVGITFRLWGRMPKQPILLQGVQDEIDKLTTRLSATDHHVFYRAAGQALTAWAQMEEKLVLLAAMLLMTRPIKAGLILYSAINFNTWLRSHSQQIRKCRSHCRSEFCP